MKKVNNYMKIFKPLNPSEIGKRLEKVRKDKKLSQQQVSEDTGISQSTICRIETGAVTINSDQANLLSLYYGITLDFLYRGNLVERFENEVKERDFEIAQGLMYLAKNCMLVNQYNNNENSLGINIPRPNNIYSNFLFEYAMTALNLQDNLNINKDKDRFAADIKKAMEKFFEERCSYYVEYDDDLPF